MRTRTVRSNDDERRARPRGRLVPIVAALLLGLSGAAGTPAAGTPAGGAPATVAAEAATVATATGGMFTSLAPRRLLDTRSGLGAPAAKVAPGATLHLQVGGRGESPRAACRRSCST